MSSYIYTNPELVKGLIAGGDIALRNAVEGMKTMKTAVSMTYKEKFNSNDVLIGVAASG